MNRLSDPTGKRALFDPMLGAPQSKSVKPTVPGGQAGKRSLFSVGDRRPGTVVTHCSACGASSRLNLAEYALRHFPVWLWIPGKTYSRLLRCSACDRLTWQAVNFFA